MKKELENIAASPAGGGFPPGAIAYVNNLEWRNGGLFGEIIEYLISEDDAIYFPPGEFIVVSFDAHAFNANLITGAEFLEEHINADPPTEEGAAFWIDAKRQCIDNFGRDTLGYPAE